MAGFEAVEGLFSGFGLPSGLITTLLLVFLIVFVGGGLIFYFYYKKFQKVQFKFIINLFQDVNGKPMWIRSDKARELKIKGTNVRILYWQKSKIYSAYPTRAMGQNSYAYKINRFGELTNFDFAAGDDEASAKIDYDHRDQTYAYLHLQNLINKNYRDKNQVWWKENLPLITVIVCAVLLGIEMWFFFSQSGKQLSQWSTISNNMVDAAKIIADSVSQSKNIGSGVVVG